MVVYIILFDSFLGVKVDLYLLGYCLFMYGLGDSFDFIYGKFNVILGQMLVVNFMFNIIGCGEIYVLCWNYYFVCSGEWSSKLVFGVDYKKVDFSCNINGGLFSGVLFNICLLYFILLLLVSYSVQ